MSQEIRVVKCYKCNTFQVDIVKKAKTWICKLCGEKQSVFKEFGRGSAKDCRLHAQKLNEQRKDREFLEQPISTDLMENLAVNADNGCFQENFTPSKKSSNSNTKWSKYVEIPYNSNTQVAESSTAEDEWLKYLETDENV